MPIRRHFCSAATVTRSHAAASSWVQKGLETGAVVVIEFASLLRTIANALAKVKPSLWESDFFLQRFYAFTADLPKTA
jgi:hypothetical protein